VGEVGGEERGAADEVEHGEAASTSSSQRDRRRSVATPRMPRSTAKIASGGMTWPASSW
jgi:hypothetical protein